MELLLESSFADRVIQSSRKLSSPIVAGMDPRPQLLASRDEEAAGTSSRRLAAAYTRFAEEVFDGLVGIVPAIKIQIAFYEELGLPGVSAYIQTLRMARERGFLVIADIKRGDIGTSSSGYAEAHFGRRAADAGADPDAVTLSPYLGHDTVEPFLEPCRTHGKGVFVLVRTSNPSAVDFQDLIAGEKPVYRHVADRVDAWGRDLVGEEGYSSVGAVVGATYPRELREIREAHPRLLLLVPGYGAQGGSAEDVASALDSQGTGLLVNSSRGILRAYREAADAGRSPANEIRNAASQMRDAIQQASQSVAKQDGAPQS